MRRVSEHKLSRIYQIIQSKKLRKLMAIISENEPINYSDLRLLTDYATPQSFAYHLAKCKNLGMVKIDDRKYMLTRIGLQVLNLVKSFEEMCYSYDLDDCDADGKIIAIIQRSENVHKF